MEAVSPLVRRFTSILCAALVLALLALPSAALAQKKQSLPDPNGAKQSTKSASGDLPTTGFSAALPLTFGLALLAAGLTVRPIRRRRRAYRTDTWTLAVHSRQR